MVIAEITLDPRSPQFRSELGAFLERARVAGARIGADSPICFFKEQGKQVHIEVHAASTVPGGAPPEALRKDDSFGRKGIPLVDLAPLTHAEASAAPQGSPELAAELKALLRKPRG